MGAAGTVGTQAVDALPSEDVDLNVHDVGDHHGDDGTPVEPRTAPLRGKDIRDVTVLVENVHERLLDTVSKSEARFTRIVIHAVAEEDQ